MQLQSLHLAFQKLPVAFFDRPKPTPGSSFPAADRRICQKWALHSIFDVENAGLNPKKPFNIGADDPRIRNSNFGPNQPVTYLVMEDKCLPTR